MKLLYLLLQKSLSCVFFLCLFSVDLFAQPCDLVLTLDVGTCVAASSTLPVYVVISNPDDEAKEVEVYLDSIQFPWSPIDIEDISPVSFTCWVTPGAFHTIFTQSTDIDSCNEALTFWVPECACSLDMSAEIAGPCNTGLETPVTVLINAISPGGAGFNLFIDGALEGGSPFPYSASSTTSLTVFLPGTGSYHLLQVSDQINPACSDQLNLLTPLCLPPSCNLVATATVSGPCGANNQVPVAFTVTPTGGGNTGFNIFLDGDLFPGSPFPYAAGSSTSVNLMVNGDGGTHILQAQDATVISCAANATVATPDCIISCALTANAVIAGSCNTNNQVPVALTVTTNGGISSGFNVILDGALLVGSPFLYTAGSSTTITLPVNGDGGTHTLQVQDASVPGCTALTNIVTPNCSLPCTVFDVVVGNTGPQVHIIQLLDYSFSPADLQVMAGDTVRFIWVSPHAHSTTSDAFSGPNIWDSGIHSTGFSYDVVITDPGSYPYYCKTHGGPNGIGMSGIITVAANCSGGNANIPVHFNVQNGTSAGYNIYINGQLLPGSPFLYQQINGTNTFILGVPGDGALRALTIQDAGISFCANTVVFTTPDCGVPCGITLNVEPTLPCNSNQQLGYTLTVTATNHGSNGFHVFLDGEIYGGGSFAYEASSATSVPFLVNGDGANHVLSVQDADSTSCTAMFTFQAPLCSGNPCNTGPLRTTIGAHQVFIVEVNDNLYTPAMLEVVTGDTIRFVWTGEHLHTVTSDTLSGDDTFNSGLHGAGFIYDVVLDQPGEHPYYCIPHGSPGGIGMSGILFAADPCDDGLLPVGIEFTNENGGLAGYMIMLDGNTVPASPFTYTISGNNYQTVNVPGDGNVHQIVVMDLVNPACVAMTTVSMADCNDPCFGFSTTADFEINHFALSIDFTVPSPASNTSYSWNFGDGFSGQGATVTHIFPAPGPYTVCLLAENNIGCFDSTCYQITLLESRCEANYQWANEGLHVAFTDHSDASVPVTIYQWDFGDNSFSSEKDPSHTFAMPGIYTVCLTITADTCVETYCSTLDLSDPCLTLSAGYSYTSVGGPLKLQFTDLTSGAPDQWLWGFGDGQTSFVQNPLHTYASPGIYNVCLITGNSVTGCFAPVFCQAIGAGVNTVAAPAAVQLLAIYPNPLDGQRQECIASGITERQFGKPLLASLMNAQGITISQTTIYGAALTRIPVKPCLPPGIYFIKIAAEDTVYTGKLSIH